MMLISTRWLFRNKVILIINGTACIRFWKDNNSNNYNNMFLLLLSEPPFFLSPFFHDDNNMAEDFTHSAHFRFRDGCCSLMTTMIVFKCNLEKIVKNAKFANLLISLCAFDVKCNFFILSTTSRLFVSNFSIRAIYWSFRVISLRNICKRWHIME